MQSFPVGDQPYYPQAQYAQPQATYYPEFTPYHPYLPVQQQNIAAPFPAYPVQYEPHIQHPTPAPHRRKLSRNITATPVTATPSSRSGTPAPPLRSAMKKTLDRAASTGAVSLSRQRTGSEHRQRVNSLTRPRADSLSAFTPDHLFLSLHSVSELRIDNIAYQDALDELREVVLPMWPHGVSYEESYENNWCVRFAGNPWTSVGTDAILAQRLICCLYVVLAHQGYSYLTTVQTANSRKSPRLIFVHSMPDLNVKIFLATFYPSKMRLSLLDAPPYIAEQLALNLRSIFPRKVSSYGANEDGVHVIEVKRDGMRTRTADANMFTSYMLQFFNSVDFKLDGSLPLGRKGALGLGSRREAWIFRSSIRRPESRQKQ